MKLTSKDLKATQKTLEALAKNEVDNPMTNYSKLNNLLKVIKDVDSIRREIWNDEKFGASFETVDETLKIMNTETNFSADDIPF